ncbi:conjugative transfer ATPase (plasmid) [Vibrio breoganii]|uniref:Conjugative transfer ATPase n=1 Tax=Vibrio breoganii TaxID=553239 RepID=A0AAN0XZC7_9VIBR|nr:conjugative transfer ATPase [Vibrio breoganii]ANO35353.1 conjugative transfer ATPase [Vibrio breoganii]
MSAFGAGVDAVKEFFGADELFSKEDLAKLYTRDLPSFAAKLPYNGFDSETGTFILEDGVSRALSFTIETISTEGRSTEYLCQMREMLEDLYMAFDAKGDSEGQWVIQEFIYDDSSVESIMTRMEDYVAPIAKGTQFTNEYLKMVRHHLEGLRAVDGGIFTDKEVTGEKWGLKLLKTKYIIYRRVVPSESRLIDSGKYDPAREVNQVFESLKMKFNQAGVSVVRDSFNDIYAWLFAFFNPQPDTVGFKTKADYYKAMTKPDPEIISGQISESLLVDFPKSSIEDNCWYFNGKPTRFLRFGGLRQAPRIGQLTGEVASGAAGSTTVRCMSDSMPKGTVLTKTVVITTQSEFELRMQKVMKSSNGATAESERKLADLQAMRNSEAGARMKVLVTMGAYISGDDLDELDESQRRVITAMNNNNVVLYKDDVDSLGLNAFLVHLPMNFHPLEDKKRYYLRSMLAQHSANLSFAFGRSEGSGNPVIFGFNRGGSPMFVDPFNPEEKSKNSMGYVVGGPGSGKSVSLCNIAYSILGMKRHRLFIVEYGNSFSVAAQDWRAKGLSVKEMVLSKGNCPSVAPFASIDRVLDDEDIDKHVGDVNSEEVSASNDEDESAIDHGGVDTLGELELLAFLMITGSDPKERERYNKGDQSLVRKVLIETARRNRDAGLSEGLGKAKPTITQDVIDTFRLMAKEPEMSPRQKEVLMEMGQAMEGYTTGFAGQLFNRPGEEWPDVDVTLINLATLSAESNRPLLNTFYTSFSQMITALGESTQYDERDVVFMTDEAHLLLSNDMLSQLIVRQVKTARKLGISCILASQNVSDCSGEAEKLLSMLEWFYCLNTTVSEARLVAKYRELSDEKVDMIVSTTKQARAYTEGVIISDKNEYLMRFVPPSLMLAVAMTESAEKAERMSLQKEHSLSCELEAAYMVASKLDKARGIPGVLEFPGLESES